VFSAGAKSGGASKQTGIEDGRGRLRTATADQTDREIADDVHIVRTASGYVHWPCVGCSELRHPPHTDRSSRPVHASYASSYRRMEESATTTSVSAQTPYHHPTYASRPYHRPQPILRPSGRLPRTLPTARGFALDRDR